MTPLPDWVSDDGQLVGAGKGPKPGSIAFYAALYAVNDRTVKRWNRTGVDNSDATPLENPELMLGWWARNMRQRVPDGINAAVIRFRRENQAAPAPVAQVIAAPASSLPAVDLPPAQAPVLREDKEAARKALMDIPVDEDAIGPEQTLRRLLELEPRLHRIADQPGQAKEYSAIVARIGPAAKALREENERMRKLIPREEAEKIIHEFHVPIERGIRQLGRTMCEIFGIPATPQAIEKWNKECDRLCSGLQQEVLR